MADLKKWENFSCSNPQEHNNEQFVYIVHSILNDSFARLLQQTSDIIEGINVGENTFIDLTKNPELVASKKIISCSLIGKGVINGQSFFVPTTYSNVGIILKVPYHNILYSDIEDLGTDYLKPDEIINFYTNKLDKGPIDLLFNTNIDSWNEVLVRGTTQYGSIEVIGVFLNYGNVDMEVDEYDMDFAYSLSQKLKLPITKIVSGEKKIKNR